jgi:hypothetical protein
VDCTAYEKRAEQALWQLRMLNFRLQLNPSEIPALRPQIRAMRNTLRKILAEPSDSAMALLETQIGNTFSALTQPTGTTIN